MKTIKFKLNSNQYQHGKDFDIEKPCPADNKIPSWWTEGESFLSRTTGKLNIMKKEDRIAGMKTCMPFLDPLVSGYLLLSWRSVEIYENENNVIKFRYVIKNENGEWVEDYSENPYTLIEERPADLGYTIPRPQGYSFNQMVWNSPWGIGLPKKWSLLITHPFNQYQLPFVTSTGIVESDIFHGNGKLPFFLKEGWTGVIEKGTPLAQYLPIKRSTWIARYFNSLEAKDVWINQELRSVSYGYYRSKIWIKKKYLGYSKKDE